MEAAALRRPPVWLERAVLFLIPPAAREAVGGDLCETFSSSPPYAAEALRTVPFVIASQLRRNAHLPTLGLQSFLIFLCLGGFSVSQLDRSRMLLLILAVLGLLLRSAYQTAGRPSARRAMIETIIVAYGALAYTQGAMLGITVVHRMPRPILLGMQFGFLVPLVPPLLCLFRTGLIIKGDGNRAFAVHTLSQQDVIADHLQFAQRIRRRNRREAAALCVAALAGLVFLRAAPLPYAPLGLLLVFVYVLAAYYLTGDGAVRVFPAGADFLSLRAHYAHELARQQQLRRFLSWLWLAPMLIALRAALTVSGQPVVVVFGSAAVILLCFIISALNREYGGWVQEKIGLLDRMPEDKELAARECSPP